MIAVHEAEAGLPCRPVIDPPGISATITAIDTRAPLLAGSYAAVTSVEAGQPVRVARKGVDVHPGLDVS